MQHLQPITGAGRARLLNPEHVEGGKKNHPTTLRNKNTHAAAPHQIIKVPALITFAMEQIVGALLPLFAAFVVAANPAPVWWGEISAPYQAWQSLSGWRSGLGAYRQLRSTVAERRIKRGKGKKKNPAIKKKKNNNHKQAPATLTKHSLPARLGTATTTTK